MHKLSLLEDDALTSFIKEVGDTAHGFNRDELKRFTKSDNSLVTSGDLWVNDKVCEYLRLNFPGDGILSEEIPLEHSSTGAFWIVDPIDGTNAYARGDNYYRILIARVEKSRATVGLAYFPAKQMMVYARAKKGCFVNNQLVRVSTNSTIAPERAFSNIATDGYSGISDPETLGEAGLAIVRLAKGELDVVVEKIVKAKLWDVAAFFVIAEEAGGRVTNINGQAPLFDTDQKIQFYGDADPKMFVATNGILHDQVLKRFASVA